MKCDRTIVEIANPATATTDDKVTTIGVAVGAAVAAAGKVTITVARAVAAVVAGISRFSANTAVRGAQANNRAAARDTTSGNTVAPAADKEDMAVEAGATAIGIITGNMHKDGDRYVYETNINLCVLLTIFSFSFVFVYKIANTLQLLV